MEEIGAKVVGNLKCLKSGKEGRKAFNHTRERMRSILNLFETTFL